MSSEDSLECPVCHKPMGPDQRCGDERCTAMRRAPRLQSSHMRIPRRRDSGSLPAQQPALAQPEPTDTKDA